MRMHSFFEAYLDDEDLLHIYRKKESITEIPVSFYMEDTDHHFLDLMVESQKEIDDYICYTCKLSKPITYGIQYDVVHELGRRTPLEFAMVVKTDRFEQRFYYDGDDLGVSYDKNGTMFKVWAPTAYRVDLEILNGERIIYPMFRDEHGVYSRKVYEDVLHQRYHYLVSVNGHIFATIDPYGKAVDANAHYSIVVNPQKPQCIQPTTPIESEVDAVVYELSVRDASEAGTFQALGMSNHSKTGIDYFASLVITHVQLLPIFDFFGVDDSRPKKFYNWGYDVNHWFSLSNAYGSNPFNPEQSIYECQMMIQEFHKKDMRVNIDVVYNHLYEIESSSLYKTVPYYYFQITDDYTYTNASMCGNDIDSSRLMCRKMIVASSQYLIDYFDIDGLRFDLMGILDVDTLNEISEKAKAKKADFMIYGEGWNMPSGLQEDKRAAIINNEKMEHVAHFSDVFRQAVKGDPSNTYYDKGYALGNVARMFQTMNVLGASVGDFGYHKIFSSPTHALNYVVCHDGYTSFDYINLACADEPNEIKRKKHKMMLAFVLLAQGIPFLHAGQEFLRTKKGVRNSYNSGDDINRLDYTLIAKNADVVTYTKDLISLRKSYPVFRKREVEDIYDHVIYDHVDEKMLVYKVSDENHELHVYFNPTGETFHVQPLESQTIIFSDGIVQDHYVDQFDVYPYGVLITKVR